ncbi:hypothetical protein diail_12124 [Diaporthe ilicicola]|nr:hypothetical protein diail_12124 [Diaporthe ilicicola]
MWAYDDGRGRRVKDIPGSRPANYYDDAYERAPPRSSHKAYPEPLPKHSSHDRHRRKSAMVDPDEPKPARRNTHHAGVNVVASDDGSGYPYGAKSSRDAYGSSYPGKSSRHDLEQKTSDKDRQFREKRGTWETDEAEKLKRAKSYSPRRAAREAEAPRRASPQAPKSNWPSDEYATQAGSGGHHRSSKKSRKEQQHYEDDPYASYYASQAPQGKKKDRGNTGYDYPPSAEEMPRPPMGDHAPFKSSPLSSYPEVPEEKPSKHHRKREKDYYGNGYDDFSAANAGTGYDRAGYGAAPVDEAPPRRSRHSKHHDDRAAGPAGVDEYGYPSQPQQHRGRHRPQPAGDFEDTDPYDRAPPARPRHRQSMPPPARSQHPGDGYDDPYGQAAPRRRATSVNYGNQDRYGGDPRRDQYYDDAYGRGGGSPPGSNGSKKKDKKSKAYAQQAGKLFMTHAVPVIKKEAVPFLTKAAQAYFEQKR